MKTQEIRDAYRDFFVERGHKAVASDAIVPRNDPTLLFTSAGMVQFKPYFRGEMRDDMTRATTCQKCFRTSDIENVGYTERHHTFFEMLGNFSFGDYFKQEAIRWAWEFSIDYMKLPKEKIWASIHDKDEESADIWLQETDLPAERIVRLGDADNFWPSSGILGPSGPCSELYFDLGPDADPGNPDGAPGDSDRYLEYWNLVFTQYDRQPDGSLPPLARKNIDTGLGLERLASIMQGVRSNFETDGIKQIIVYFESLAGTKFRENTEKDVSLRVLADHIRATAFVLTDGVMPSNNGRGYVLRRIMRRAIRHGLLLGIDKNLMSPAIEVVAENYAAEYPDVKEQLNFTRRIAAAEEETFRSTLTRGLVMLGEMVDESEQAGNKELSGEKAFVLYDTYGMPADLTEEILKERGFSGYNQADFDQCMNEQRKRAQAAWRGSGESKVEVDVDVASTKFTGYDSLQEESKILALYQKGNRVDSVVAGQPVEIITEITPFYAESGGQIGDKGTIEASGDGFATVRIETTRKTASGVYVHFGEVEQGTINTNDTVKLTVDESFRAPIMKHHTATHLLQAALQSVLGNHVKQAGSLVEQDHFRFDFTHFESVKQEQLREIERMINQWVYENHPVQTQVTSLKDARARGAMALFGEKYGDEVRMVEVLNEADTGHPVSLELCGGTHVRATGDIGSVRILSESSVSAGNRRIEAAAGPIAVAHTQKEHSILSEITSRLNVPADEAPDRINRLLDQIKVLEKENKDLRQKSLQSAASDFLSTAEDIGGVQVITHQLDDAEKDELQAAMDSLMNEAKSRVAFLASASNGNVTFICGISSDLTNKFDAGKIVKEVAKIAGGGGGGRRPCASRG
jgi:alanyl-tRNA synthetase